MIILIAFLLKSQPFPASCKTLLGLSSSLYTTGGISESQMRVMECSRVIFFVFFLIFFFFLSFCDFPSKYKHLQKRWGCLGSLSGVQIWMQSNRDTGVGLLRADESRQTEENKGEEVEGGGGEGHLFPAYLKFSLRLITNHSSDSARELGERRARPPLSHFHLYPRACSASSSPPPTTTHFFSLPTRGDALAFKKANL